MLYDIIITLGVNQTLNKVGPYNQWSCKIVGARVKCMLNFTHLKKLFCALGWDIMTIC